MKISFFCKNKHHPEINAVLDTMNGPDGPFGALQDMSKTFGGTVKVGPPKEVMEQYGGPLTAEIANMEKMTAGQFVETISFISEEISEKFDIPQETILFRAEV